PTLKHLLENLDPERFQQLVHAMLVDEFPSITCFPVGQPDGGRDATQTLEHGTDGARFAVYQVKYNRDPNSVESPAEWLVDRSDDEREKIKRLVTRGAAEYILITNISGTSHLDVGSIDKVTKKLQTEVGIPVKCWWRDDIDRRLDGKWDIKLRYPEIL